MAWGSRGVTIGHDVSSEIWENHLEQALTSFDQTPYILQRYHKPAKQALKHLNTATEEIREFQGRTRLCPYFMVNGQDNPEITLTGILATSCPADKKIIHGMADAIMAPCALLP